MQETEDRLTPELKEKFWGPGEWVDELDFFDFEYEGFRCMGRRSAVWDGERGDMLFGGFWCGYVVLPPSHPWENKFPHELDCDVHGGITFFEMELVGWIVGFDCAHSEDYCPSLEMFRKKSPQIDSWKIELFKKFPNLESSRLLRKIYRNIEFVKNECKSLAKQAKEAQNGKS